LFSTVRKASVTDDVIDWLLPNKILGCATAHKHKYGVESRNPCSVSHCNASNGIALEHGTRPVTRGGEALSRKFFAPLEKCVGYSLKLLNIIQKIWAPLRKLFAPPGVPN